MIEVTNPWVRVPFQVGDSNVYGSGNNNDGIINPLFTNLKADPPKYGGGGAAVSFVYLEVVFNWLSDTDYEAVATPRFQVVITEGDFANAPWVGLKVNLETTLTTEVGEDIGGVSNTTTTYSTLSYTYNLTAANFIPSPTDPNYNPSTNQYVTPWASTPEGPSYLYYKYEDLGGGDFRETYGTINPTWKYISVVPGDFEVG